MNGNPRKSPPKIIAGRWYRYRGTFVVVAKWRNEAKAEWSCETEFGAQFTSDERDLEALAEGERPDLA